MIHCSADQPEEITRVLRELNEVHVIATVHIFNLFLPLIQKGNAKKVIATTTGYTDNELTREYELYVAPFYTASKAAQNALVAKYHAQYAQDGILFLALAPGSVEVGQYGNRTLVIPEIRTCLYITDSYTMTTVTEEQQQKLAITGGKFMKYAPDFTGPITTEASIGLMLNVINNATVEKNGGDVLSQKGNKTWL
jgi:NAD(P)-dependent dehydrogenase (short-subunit alcohol dehydrogenase family)